MKTILLLSITTLAFITTSCSSTSHKTPATRATASENDKGNEIGNPFVCNNDAGSLAGVVDIAESNLRVVLNRPARGTFSRDLKTTEAKMGSMARLVNLAGSRPGLLEGEGKFAPCSRWDQYEEVIRLYREFQEKYDITPY